MTRHSPPCATCDNTTVALVSGQLVPCPVCKPKWHRCYPTRSLALDAKGRPTSHHERAVGYVCHPADIEEFGGKARASKPTPICVCIYREPCKVHAATVMILPPGASADVARKLVGANEKAGR